MYDFNEKTDEGFMAVFDGHSGQGASQWARDNFARLLAEEINASEASAMNEENYDQIFERVFAKVDEELAREGINSGSTVACALLCWEKSLDSCQRVLYTANAGDSKVILR